MSCCERYEPGPPPEIRRTKLAIDRRTALKGLAGAVGLATVAAGGGVARAQGRRIQLAFCGQLLCVVPYEVTRHRGHFADEGLDVELVYTRGGNAAMQALVGGAVDYAGTSFDVAVQAFANGAPIHRFASTGRLPLFALAVAPRALEQIREVGDLAGTTVGISALGNADHTLMLFLLAQAGIDADSVRFATLGTNLFDALRLGQVDAGMVQEPSLSLIVEAGGGTLVNVMEIEDATRHLGGAYEFMGVSVRTAEQEDRLDEMRALARALARGLQDTRTIPVEDIADALPPELIAGGDRERLLGILDRYRASLYPESVAIDVAAAERVVNALAVGGMLEQEVDLGRLLDTTVVEG